MDSINLKRILNDLMDLSFSSQIVVFGSASLLGAEPGDIDVCIIHDNKSGNTSTSQYQEIMSLARREYGWLDPFILSGERLLVRNDEATGWIMAKNAKSIKASIRRDGIPLRTAIENVSSPIRQPLDPVEQSRSYDKPNYNYCRKLPCEHVTSGPHR